VQWGSEITLSADLTGLIKVFDADVNIDITQASPDEVERAALLIHLVPAAVRSFDSVSKPAV
jgi:hypothetical protein